MQKSFHILTEDGSIPRVCYIIIQLKLTVYQMKLVFAPGSGNLILIRHLADKSNKIVAIQGVSGTVYRVKKTDPANRLRGPVFDEDHTVNWY